MSFIKNLEELGIRKPRKKDSPPECLSPETVRKHYVLLHTLLGQAVKWDMLPSNPVAKVERPKVKRTPKQIPDEKALGTFLKALDQHANIEHQALCYLALSTGLRRGELYGLQWKHLDFDNNTILVEQTGNYLPGEGKFTKTPKNESSNRVVTTPPSVMALLKQLKKTQTAQRLKLGGLATQGGKWAGAENPDNDRVLTAWNGAPQHPDNFNSWLAGFCERHSLPHLSPHSFRHLAATYMITGGTDLRTVAGKLGHSSSVTTQIVYSHLLKSAEKETANLLDNVIQKAKNAGE